MFVEILKIEFYTEFDVVVATDSANVGVKVACHPKYPSLTIMLRRAHSYLSTGFLTFNVADTQKKRIMQDRIGIALGEICSSPSDPLESPDGLDLVEFFRVVRRCCTLILVKLLLTDGLIFHCLSINVSDALIACRATELEQWAASLPLAQLVADALPRPAQGQSIQEPARFVAELTDEQVCGLRREEAL